MRKTGKLKGTQNNDEKVHKTMTGRYTKQESDETKKGDATSRPPQTDRLSTPLKQLELLLINKQSHAKTEE